MPERQHLVSYLIKVTIKHLKINTAIYSITKIPQRCTELNMDVSHVPQEEKSRTD